MNPNEIKKALECCCSKTEMFCTKDCPLYEYNGNCWYAMKFDALAYIKQLEDRVKDLKFFNKRFEEENNSLQSMRTTLYNKIDEYQAEVERLKGIVNTDVAFVGMRSGKSEKVKQIMMLRAKEIKSEAIEDFRQRVNKKMGKHTSYLGKEYVQRIMREVKKEMVGDKGV